MMSRVGPDRVLCLSLLLITACLPFGFAVNVDNVQCSTSTPAIKSCIALLSGIAHSTSNPYSYSTLTPFDPALLNATLLVPNILRLMALQFPSKDCVYLGAKFMCLQAYGACYSHDTNTNTTISITRPVCYADCQTWASGCGTALRLAWQFLGQPTFLLDPYLPNCSMIDASPSSPSFGQPIYPASQQTWSYNNDTFSVDCLSAVDEVLLPEDMAIECYDPWIPVKGEAGPFCQVQQCPLLIYSRAVYRAAKIILSVLGWLSWIATFFVLVNMLLQPHLRNFPGNISIMMALSSNIISFAFVFGSLYGWERLWCDGQTNSDSGACVWQGLVLIFGAWSGAFFWMLIGVNTFIALVMKKEWFSTPFFIVSMVIGWGVPGIIAAIVLGAKKISYYSSSAFCFVNLEDHDWWQYGLFYIPTGVFLLVGAVCIISVSIEMRKVKGVSKLSTMYKHLRILIFLAGYGFIVGFLFVYRFYFTGNKQDFTKAYTEWATCAASSPDCKHGRQPLPGIFLINLINISGQGIFVAILFSSTKESLRLWRVKWGALRGGQLRKLFAAQTVHTATVTSRSGVNTPNTRSQAVSRQPSREISQSIAKLTPSASTVPL